MVVLDWIQRFDEAGQATLKGGRPWSGGSAGGVSCFAGANDSQGDGRGPSVSHQEGLIFLNVLGVLDVREALGLLAACRLVQVGAQDPRLQRTEEIYRRTQAADQLPRW